MSMLADPRRKQKWTLNPRGKQWSEDSNKFGQKMLEKMGWTHGKGLGANGQGITEHVRVSFKDDKSGIGFKQDDLDKTWTEQQDSFNDLLSKLQEGESHNVVPNKENKGALSGKSLELKSKQSRARVHYQKFTRSKDINKYSSKDLANIFGQKELNVKKSDTNKENGQEKDFNSIGTEDNRGGVTTIYGGNMAEYFTRKSRDFSLTTGTRKQRNDSESESEYPGFGFASAFGETKSSDVKTDKKVQKTSNYAFENPCVQFDSPESILNDEYMSPKKRKLFYDNELSLSTKVKKFKEENIDEDGSKNGIVNAALNLECQDDEACNGKEFEVSRVQFGVANSGLDLSDEADRKKRVTFNDHVEYSTDPVKKKKNRTKLDKFEVENKKAKKKKRNYSVDNPITFGFVNDALDVAETPEEVNDNELNEEKSKKSKKRRESRRSNLETIIEIPEEDKACEVEAEVKRIKLEDNVCDESMCLEDIEDKPKKKKKQKHKEKQEKEVTIENEQNGVEKINAHETVVEKNIILEDESTTHKGEDVSKRKKKKKKSKNKDIETHLEENESIISKTKEQVDTKNMEEENVEPRIVKVEKKRKTKNDYDVNNLSVKTNTKDEKEVSDKENTRNGESETSKPKKKTQKKLENESNNHDFVHSTEYTEKEEFTEQTDVTIGDNALPKHFNNKSPNNYTPWNQRAKTSKKLLMSFFHRNSTQNYFPGSNVNEIKGYGIDIQ